MKQLYLTIAIGLLLAVAGCDEKEKISPLWGVWHLVQMHRHTYTIPASIETDTTWSQPSVSYMEFRNNGLVYFYSPNASHQYDTAKYNLEGNDLMIYGVDDDSEFYWQIQKLTDDTLVVYNLWGDFACAR